MKKVLLIFAHPDDESFSCSGTVHKLAKEGADIKLITATRGEAGESGNPPVCLPEEMGEQRTRELKCAAKIIGIKDIYFLGLRDGTLIRFSIRYIALILLPIIKRLKPDLIISFAPTGISGHDDHIVISKATLLAYRQYKEITKNNCYLWQTTLPESLVEKMRQKKMVRDIFRRSFKGSPDKKINKIVDIRDVLSVKVKALNCHQTQHADWQRYLSRIKEGFTDYEYFIEVK